MAEVCETKRFSSASEEKMDPSPPASQTAFTLSFGGVDFRLTPDEAKCFSGGDNMPMLSLPPSNGGDLVVNLFSFTGTLRVTVSPNGGNSTTAKVEEDPPSPVAANPSNLGAHVSPRQQKIQFTKTDASTKRSRDNSAKEKTFVATPRITPNYADLPSAPSKKGGAASQHNRTIPEIAPNPQPSPTPRKKTRREGIMPVESAQVDLPLGQLSQLSQTGPSQSIDNDIVEDMIGVMDSNPTFLPSSINSADIHEDEESTASSNILDKDSASIEEENTIVEDDEEGAVATSSLEAPAPAALPRQGLPPPSSRWGHTFTNIGCDRLLVYGGQQIDVEAGKTKTLSDIHVFDEAKRVWYKPVNCEGVPRQWHSATFIPERQILISFGGESSNPKTGKITTTDQVMVLDTEIMLWYPPTVSGTVPSGRSGHTATLLPNSSELVVFGGVRGNKWQNSVAVLDISRWKWMSPKIYGDAPRPRSYHSATAVSGNGEKNRLVIFGGNDRAAIFNTVHVLETDGKKWTWSHPKATGTVPSPRTGHCATLLDDKKTILIYGGWDPNADEDEDVGDDEMIFSDSYLLDTERWTWSVGPKPVFAGDGAASSTADSLAKNGGERRVGHKAVLTNGEDGAQVLVFGGRIPNDQFACDFQTLTVPESLVGFCG